MIFIAKLIFDFRVDVSLRFPLSISFDCSLIEGMSVTASEPISVDGIMINGNVMPMMIPNSERASFEEYPNFISRSGMIIAMIDETIEDAVLTAVIGVLVFIRDLNCGFGL